ncbi:MAG: hypothetical protein KF855_04940 [Acidobacteria bacterium]|nr:hypothetical protein [Acidobacteriota bacterium]
MPSYRQIGPIVQSGWYTCWAASMSWWLRAMSDRGRQFLTEEEMLNKFPLDWDQNGAMTLKGMSSIFGEQAFGMSYRFGNQKDLDKLVGTLSSDPAALAGAFPIIVGYKDDNAGGNHVAVLCEQALDTYGRSFVTMDPFPGAYRTRSRDYLAGDNMFFGWPKEAGQIL